MAFGKKILSFFVVSFSLVVTPTASTAEKLQSIDAIWNAVGVNNLQNTAPAYRKNTGRATAQNLDLNARKLIAAANKKLDSQQPNVQTKTVAKQIQKQVIRVANKKPLTKLDRQRAAWRAKWEAEQRAKLAKTKPAAKPAVKQSTPKIEKGTVANNETPLWKQAEKALAQSATPPKPLTREQYHQRWQQQQRQKQQAQAKRPVRENLAVLARKPTPVAKYPVHRKNNQRAIINGLPPNVRQKLQAARLNPGAMSAYVQAVNSPRPLLGHQDRTSRVPASVMKLITAYAALGTLGPNYRWPVDVYARGPVRNGTLQGDLIIKGYGSPEFNQADLRKLLHGIRQKGIRNVKGRVVFDDTYFSIPRQGAFDGKTQASYNALPDALLYNERISTFKVRARGKRVHVSSTTPTHNLKIVNKMRTSKRRCRPHIKVSNRGAQTVVTFSGRFSRRCGTRSYSRVISRPAEMIYGAMQAMWKRDVGGSLQTKFAMGKAPNNARPLLRNYSRTLKEILPTVVKDSNNVMARQILLTIGAKHSGGRGTPHNGANAIGAWLASRGLNFPELRIENGSGLSRHARISARHVGDLLVDAYRSPYRNVFMQSMAIAGVDGTMKRRLKNTRVRGRGFFKTGTLRDVRSIAGYVKGADGKTYVVSILHNDPRARRRALAAHDSLIKWVFSGGRDENLAMR